MAAKLLLKNITLGSANVTLKDFGFCMFIVTYIETNTELYNPEATPPGSLLKNRIPHSLTRPAITCFKLTIETLEQEVK